MANNFNDNIRKIAKTQKILDVLNKISKDIPDALKDAIVDERGIGLSQNNGSSTGNFGGGPGTPQTSGTGQFGDPTLGPIAPPPTPPNDDTKDKNSTDDALNSNKDNNLDSQNNNGNDLYGNRLNSPGNALYNAASNASTGSPYAKQAQRGANDPEIQGLKTAMTDRGAGTNAIDAAISKYTAIEQGVHDIADLFLGKGPELFDPNNPDKQVLNGIVGVDPLNTGNAFILRNGYLSPPNPIDLAVFGMSDWPDPLVAPVDTATFKPGFYWDGPIDAVTTIFSKTCTAIISSADAYSKTLSANSGDFIGFVHTGDSITSANIKNPDQIISLYPSGAALTAVFNDIVTPFPAGFHIVAGCAFAACPGAPGPNPDVNAVCFTGDPTATYTAYPKSGIATFAFSDGKITSSPFDTEVPLRYKNQDVSSINIMSKIDNQTYTFSPAINGGYALYKQDMSGIALIYGADNTLRQVLPSTDLLPFYTPKQVRL